MDSGNRSASASIPPTALITERLLLRPFTLADAERAFRWFSDGEVMRFIPGGADRTLQDTEKRLTRYLEHDKTYGFTKWLVTDRHTGELLGDGGLYHLPGDSRIELGFRFAREHWGKGYASEMGAAWIKEFHRSWPGEPLYGIVLPEHRQSQHVLEKLGFAPQPSETVYGKVMRVYALPPKP